MTLSPGIQVIASRILARERLPLESPQELAAALSDVFTRIEQVTASMVGQVGYGALLQRAHKRARGAYPWLPDQVEAEFPARGWEPLIATHGAAANLDAAASLLLGVLDLVASFLGEDFTYRLVRRAWPDSGSRPVGPRGEHSESEET
jgi:hypothetical protein